MQFDSLPSLDKGNGYAADNREGDTGDVWKKEGGNAVCKS